MFFSISAFAVKETQLKSIYFSDVIPLLTQKSQSGTFDGKLGTKIHYYKYSVQAPKGVIVVSPGQKEEALKYAEFVFDLKDQGYDIFVIDHRGQGASGRLLSDSRKSHVENFEDYVEDFTKFILEVVRPTSYSKSLLYTHSMGGAIGAGFLENHPKVFNRVVMSAPMFKIDTKQYPEVVALGFSSLLIKGGMANEYAPEQKAYDPNEKFDKSTLTTSSVRFELDKQLRIKYPNLIVGGVTTRWINTSLSWTRRIRKVPFIFQIPTTIVQVSDDKWVKPEGQEEICRGSRDFCNLVEIQGAKHGTLSERDVYRDQLMTIVIQTLQSM